MRNQIIFKRGLFVIFFLLVLTACEEPWYLTIDEKSRDKPILCFFADRFFNDSEGVQFIGLNIYEVNTKGAAIQVMWSIGYDFKSAQSDDAILKRVTYGILPKGWKEDQIAKLIQSNKYYEVNKGFYFIKSSEGKYQVSDDLNELIKWATRNPHNL